MKNTVSTLLKQKQEGKKISMLTCYDYSTAKLMEEVGVNTILVGDSLGNTMLGYFGNDGRHDSSLCSSIKRLKEHIFSL